MAEWGFPDRRRLPCADLTVEQRQIVEIARALAAGTRCLLLDEPTAALERGAIERLFARVRQLTGSGVAVLYISHHLEEVFEICQDVAVLRDGELVLTSPAAGQLTKDDLVDRHGRCGRAGPAPAGTDRGHGAGRGGTGTHRAARPEGPTGRPRRLAVERRVSLASPGASLSARLAGRAPRASGSGSPGCAAPAPATLARVVAGAEPYHRGPGAASTARRSAGPPRPGPAAGVGYIPEDRQRGGVRGAAGRGRERHHDDRRPGWPRFAGLLRPRARAAAAAPLAPRAVHRLGRARPAGGELSGGNQQKVTVARAMAREPAADRGHHPHPWRGRGVQGAAAGGRWPR